MIKYKVTLTKEERAESEEISSKSSHKSQKVLNALILINCDEGEFQLNRSRNEEIAKVLNISMKKSRQSEKAFC